MVATLAAALTIALSALVILYLVFYFYLWKKHPCCSFNVLETAYLIYIGVGLFGVSNVLLVINRLQPLDIYNDAATVLNFFALLSFFLALYLKIKKSAYAHLQHEHPVKVKKQSKKK